jgi:hypothetical protein
MKQKLKQFTTLMAFCALLVLSSCEKDLYDETIYKDNLAKNLRIEEKSFNELMVTKKFNYAYNQIEKSKNKATESSVNKTDLENEYNFTIVNTSPIKVITNDEEEQTTYIMLIERTISENLKFENLVINDKNGVLDARIFKYTLSKEGEKNEIHGGFELDIINTEMINLEINGKLGMPCVVTATLMCDDIGSLNSHGEYDYEHDHLATGFCITHSNNLYVEWGLNCSGGGGDGDYSGPTSGGDTAGGSESGTNGTSGSSGSNDSGTSVGNGNPTIPTSPIPCFHCIESNEITNPNDPCKSLREIIDDIDVQLGVNNLKPKTLLNQENAIAYERRINFDGVYHYNPLPSGGSNFSSNADTGGYIVASAHNHPINGQAIPSWGDIRWVKNCEMDIRQSYAGQGLSSSIVVVPNRSDPSSDPIIYCIKIENFTILQNQITNDLNTYPEVVAETNSMKKIELMNLRFAPKFSDVQNSTVELEKRFLEVFHNYGIQLYKYDESNQIWNKLQLNLPYNPGITNQLISIPCPN